MRLTLLPLGMLTLSVCLWGMLATDAARSQEFDPVEVIPRPFPAITDPNVVSVDLAGGIRDNELVIGVVVDGQARAYPINMLTGPRREIINDELAGMAIAATW